MKINKKRLYEIIFEADTREGKDTNSRERKIDPDTMAGLMRLIINTFISY